MLLVSLSKALFNPWDMKLMSVMFKIKFLRWTTHSVSITNTQSVDTVQVNNSSFVLRIAGNTYTKYWVLSRPDSVAGIATGYGLDGRGSNPGGGEIFSTCPDRPWDPPSLLYNGYRVFPGGKKRPGRDADASTPSSAAVKKEYSYTSTPPMGRTACTDPQCLYKGALYLLFYWMLKYLPCILFVFTPVIEVNGKLKFLKENVCRSARIGVFFLSWHFGSLKAFVHGVGLLT